MEERDGSGEQARADGGDRADGAETAPEDHGDGGASRPRNGEAESEAAASGRARRRLPLPVRLRVGAVVTVAPDGEESGLQPEGDSEEEQESEEEREQEQATMLDVFRSIPTQMDYKGQKLAEQIFQGTILVSAVIGFICGYVTEQFGWTVYIVMAGFALTLPPWPMYRRNPLKWLPVQESGTEDKKPADRKPKRHSKS
ncbi:hypothetical protein CIB84_012764 [Bambusicola thoracicus]|uniref:Signal peptidase complex subunit 1 n=1 Tax=Bambusicola thoracicus TaxID=9083 RepID=A0A2P4SH96_BAMTH|nr:hypothetical protein CIB84_012764 [Bambusicola thoracicus]